MNTNFKTFLHIAKKISLSEEKKGLIRSRIEEFILMSPVTSIPSPLKTPFYISKFSVLNFGKVVSFALIVLIAGGGTISYAAEDTLPGDVFYTVKVNFTEPIEETLAFSQEAKLGVKTKQVEKRLNEVQILLKKNDISPEKHKEAGARVEKNMAEISDSIDKLQEKGNVEAVLETTSKLQPVLKAHQEALKEVSDNSKQENLDSILTQEVETLTVTTVSTEGEFVETTETKSDVADNLLKTVERTLENVEQKESKALETFDQLEKNGQDIQRVSDTTTKKFEQATLEIGHIKDAIDKKTKNDLEESVANTENLELFIDSGISSINTNLKDDYIMLTLIEAEILLEESKQLFDQGLYKQSLEKAQEALKLTASIEVNKKIDTAQESSKNIENVTKPIETPVILNTQTVNPTSMAPETPIKEIEQNIEDNIKPTIKIEDQASHAIESLQKTLKIN